MRRIISQHRTVAATLALLSLLTASAILIKPRIAHAFTLIPANIIFDPISVTSGQTLHLHFVNQLGATPYGIFTTCKPTTPGLGSMVSGAPIIISPGDGSDQSFPFGGFSPTPGTTRIPVVCTVAVVIPTGGFVPSDFSARVASSIEIIDDVTGRPTEILASRHIIQTTPAGMASPCVSCN